MRRARELASRSWRTVIIVSVLQIVIPTIIGALVGKVSIGVSYRWVVGPFAEEADLSATGRVGKHLCHSADVDRAGAALSEDAAIRR